MTNNGRPTSAARNENRFSAEDADRIRRRIRETVTGWIQGSTTGRLPNDDVNRDVLIRLGAHAVGLGVGDLRDSEIDWIADQVDAVIGVPAKDLPAWFHRLHESE